MTSWFVMENPSCEAGDQIVDPDRRDGLLRVAASSNQHFEFWLGEVLAHRCDLHVAASKFLQDQG